MCIYAHVCIYILCDRCIYIYLLDIMFVLCMYTYSYIHIYIYINILHCSHKVAGLYLRSVAGNKDNKGACSMQKLSSQTRGHPWLKIYRVVQLILRHGPDFVIFFYADLLKVFLLSIFCRQNPCWLLKEIFSTNL